MLSVARDNMDLTRYLIGQVMQSPEQRLEALRKFYPEARAEDWRLEVAGQRVQIIKKDPKKGGILQFGTELVAAHGSIAALLGLAGRSVTVSIMLGLIERCFPEQARSPEWSAKLKEIFPARERAGKRRRAVPQRQQPLQRGAGTDREERRAGPGQRRVSRATEQAAFGRLFIWSQAPASQLIIQDTPKRSTRVPKQGDQKVLPNSSSTRPPSSSKAS